MTEPQPRGHTGFRHISACAIVAPEVADSPEGLPSDFDRNQVLNAFKRAAPLLGIPIGCQRMVDLLFRWTQQQDWQQGARPIVWPSNQALQDEAGLSLRQVQYIRRSLEEQGLITAADSPTGKRWGRRDQKGRILEAYGIDLSPLARRLAEFASLIAQAEEYREARTALRRAVSIARREVIQIAQAAEEAGFDTADWTAVAEQADRLGRLASRIEDLADLDQRLGLLRQLRDEAVEAYQDAFEAAGHSQSAVYNSSQGAMDCTHIQLQPNSKLNTCRTSPQARQSDRSQPPPPNQTFRDPTCGTVEADLERHQISPLMVQEMCPDLGLDIEKGPTWPDVIERAEALSRRLGINPHAWGEACGDMGRNGAAVAVAVISAKSAQIRSPGGYLRGMAGRAKCGDLNLGRSVYKLLRS